MFFYLFIIFILLVQSTYDVHPGCRQLYNVRLGRNLLYDVRLGRRQLYHVRQDPHWVHDVQRGRCRVHDVCLAHTFLNYVSQSAFSARISVYAAIPSWSPKAAASQLTLLPSAG